jgi:hypothetical protein
MPLVYANAMPQLGVVDGRENASLSDRPVPRTVTRLLKLASLPAQQAAGAQGRGDHALARVQTRRPRSGGGSGARALGSHPLHELGVVVAEQRL